MESIELTDDNLAKVVVSVEQELHEGTTAIIRATSLSGVANHYVSISPGPNSNPPLENDATLGLASTTTPIDIDQLFNTFPAPVRRGLAQFIQGNSRSLCRRRQTGQRHLQIPRRRLQPRRRLRPRDQRRRKALLPLPRQLEQARHDGLRTRRRAFQRDLQRQRRVWRDRQAERRARPQPAAAAADLPPGQHDLRQPARRARRRRTADRHLEDGDQGTWPHSSPNFARCSRRRCRSSRTCASTVRRLASPTTRPNCSASLPAVQQRASRAFPHSEGAITGLPAQPQLHPRLLAGPLQRLRQARPGQRPLRRQRPLRARQLQPTSTSSTTTAAAAALEPIAPSEQYDAFGASAGVKRRCPGGAPASPPPTAPAPSSNRPTAAPA